MVALSRGLSFFILDDFMGGYVAIPPAKISEKSLFRDLFSRLIILGFKRD